MQVGLIMTKDIISVDLDASIHTIRKLFSKYEIHHVVVLDDNRLVGVISDRDLLRAISPFVGTLSERQRDVHTLEKRAHQIMSRNPVTVSTETPIRTAAAMLIQHQVSALPVVSADNRIEGIVSWKDFLRFFL